MFHGILEIFKYRVLIQTLVLRELKSRYRGSFFGFLWSFLNPLFLMLVYTLVFSIYLRNPMEGYPAFLFCGLLPWLWFSTSIMHGAASIRDGGHLIKKVVFPAEILPLIAVLSNMINFLLSLPILFIFLLIFNIAITPLILLFPLLLLIQFILSTGLAFFLSAVNVHFKDIQQILNNLLMLLFFLTPILYPVTFIPDKYRQFFLILNPLFPLMTSYQDILFNGRLPGAAGLSYLIFISILILFIGYNVFNKFRDTFAEEV
jgi:ABC-type polysaccharide/polyol phosphate export permease